MTTFLYIIIRTNIVSESGYITIRVCLSECLYKKATNSIYKNDMISNFVSSIRFYKKFKTCSNEENIFPFQITDSKFVFMYFHLYPILTVNQNLLYDLNCREDFVTSYTIKLKYKNVIRFF